MPSMVPVSLGGEAGGREQAGKWSSVVCLSVCLPAGTRSLGTQSRHQVGPGNHKALCKQHRVGAKSALSKKHSGLKYAPDSAKDEGPAKCSRHCNQVNTDKRLEVRNE